MKVRKKRKENEKKKLGKKTVRIGKIRKNVIMFVFTARDLPGQSEASRARTSEEGCLPPPTNCGRPWPAYTETSG